MAELDLEMDDLDVSEDEENTPEPTQRRQNLVSELQ